MIEQDRRSFLKTVSLVAVAAAVPPSVPLFRGCPKIADLGGLTQWLCEELGAKAVKAVDKDFGWRLGVGIEMHDGRRNGILIAGGKRDFEAMTDAQRYRVAEKVADAFREWLS